VTRSSNPAQQDARDSSESSGVGRSRRVQKLPALQLDPEVPAAAHAATTRVRVSAGAPASRTRLKRAGRVCARSTNEISSITTPPLQAPTCSRPPPMALCGGSTTSRTSWPVGGQMAPRAQSAAARGLTGKWIITLQKHQKPAVLERLTETPLCARSASTKPRSPGRTWTGRRNTAG